MSQLFEIARIQSKGAYALPASMNREIGRVIVRWAFFERQIQQMIWGIAFDADSKGAALGRTAVIEPKFPDRLNLLVALAKIRRVKYDATLFKSIKSQCKPLNEERNLLAHGSWTKVPDYGWLVQQTRGAWETPSPFVPEGPTGSKRATPEAVQRSTEDIAQTVTAIEKLIKDTQKFQVSLARAPSPDKHPKPRDLG